MGMPVEAREGGWDVVIDGETYEVRHPERVADPHVYAVTHSAGRNLGGLYVKVTETDAQVTLSGVFEGKGPELERVAKALREFLERYLKH